MVGGVRFFFPEGMGWGKGVCWTSVVWMHAIYTRQKHTQMSSKTYDMNTKHTTHATHKHHNTQRLAQQAGVQRLKIITYNFDRPLHTIPEDKYV